MKEQRPAGGQIQRTQAPDAGPPLKWAGGKRWLVPRLALLWKHARQPRLVEPFCGGLAVALGLLPPEACLNDINPHAINFYRQLQRGLEIKLPMANDKALYYAHREAFNDAIERNRANTKKAASLFYFLNRTGFNGLCRFNKRGLFNVPFGKFTSINYRRDLRLYQAVLSPWQFTNLDFAEMTLEPSDFIYADPPYDVQFHHYASGGFGWEDQLRLAHWLTEHPGPVVASNQATDRIVALYEGLGFAILYLDAPRWISSTGDRSPAKEILAIRGLDIPTELAADALPASEA